MEQLKLWLLTKFGTLFHISGVTPLKQSNDPLGSPLGAARTSLRIFPDQYTVIANYSDTVDSCNLGTIKAPLGVNADERNEFNVEELLPNHFSTDLKRSASRNSIFGAIPIDYQRDSRYFDYHVRQSDQCSYASFTAAICFFYCKGLGISKRYGVWECILYLMNLFHNYGVDHLVISYILILSYGFIKRRRANVERLLCGECTDIQLDMEVSEKKLLQLREGSSLFELHSPYAAQRDIHSFHQREEVSNFAPPEQHYTQLWRSSVGGKMNEREGMRRTLRFRRLASPVDNDSPWSSESFFSGAASGKKRTMRSTFYLSESNEVSASDIGCPFPSVCHLTEALNLGGERFSISFSKEQQSEVSAGLASVVHSEPSVVLKNDSAEDISAFRFAHCELNHGSMNSSEGVDVSDLSSLRLAKTHVPSTSRALPDVPLHTLDDCRLIWTIFVSCWLAYISLEDIKIPLLHWCDILKIVPLDEETRKKIELSDFQHHFIEEVVKFWQDLNCKLFFNEADFEQIYLDLICPMSKIP